MNGKVSRGPNWGDMDSKLLIDAVRFIAENPICTDYQKIVLTVVAEGKCVKDQRMVDYFNTLNPKSGEHTLKSFASHWSEMQVSYRSFAPCMHLICRLLLGSFGFRLRLCIVM